MSDGTFSVRNRVTEFGSGFVYHIYTAAPNTEYYNYPATPFPRTVLIGIEDMFPGDGPKSLNDVGLPIFLAAWKVV